MKPRIRYICAPDATPEVRRATWKDRSAMAGTPPVTAADDAVDERDVEAAREDGKETGFIAGMLTTSALWIVIVSALLYFWR